MRISSGGSDAWIMLRRDSGAQERGLPDGHLSPAVQGASYTVGSNHVTLDVDVLMQVDGDQYSEAQIAVRVIA